MRFVNWDYSEDDFEFVFREGKVCRVHSIFAEFLSPNVARARRSDVSVNVYTFKSDSSELFDVFETLVLRLVSGQSFCVDKSNFPALLVIFQELDNRELLSSLLGMINHDSLNLEEAILLLQAGTALGMEFVNLTNFVASNFYKIDREALEDLDIETVQLLLSSPSLKIEDEDSLYDFVRSRSEKDLSFTGLFEFVCFEYLNIAHIEDFVSFSNTTLNANISAGLWTRIRGRLLLESKPNASPRVSHQRPFFYNPQKPLEGIIANLTRKCGGNVHDKGIVNITTSSVFSTKPDIPEYEREFLDYDISFEESDSEYDEFPGKNAADLGIDTAFMSENKKDTWITYDFKERRVIPASYSVKSQGDLPGGDHLKSWVIEVSNDEKQKSWIEIDRREDNYDLNGSSVTRNFKISRVPSTGFRFVRLRQTGRNHSQHYYVAFACLEIFGTLINI